MVPAWSHKPNDAGSIPAPATNSFTTVKLFFWSVRLGVRTSDFHSGNTGSIPVPTTKTISELQYPYR